MTQLHITAASAFGPLGKSLDEVWQSVLDRKTTGGVLHVASGRKYLAATTRGGHTTNTKTYSTSFAEGLRSLVNDLELNAPVDVIFVGTAVGNLCAAEHEVYVARDLAATVLDFANLRPMLDKCAAISGDTEIVVVPTGCCAGLQAAGLAKAVMAQMGYRTGIIVSLDMGLTPLAFEAFSKINATADFDEDSTVAPISRPFCKERSGFLFADGGGAIAVSIDAPKTGPVPRLTGYGCVSSAYHMTDIETGGVPIAKSIAIALADANCDPRQIGHVNLHASGTQQNDAAEHNALAATLNGAMPPITAFKGNHGHALAGANMLEVALTWKMMTTGTVPPTPHGLAVDAYDDVPARDAATQLEPGAILKTASGFAGIHATLVLEN
ncbi:MAG: hypothetical protein ABJQ34_13680 [Paracoccaceae bacterium]